jgi:DNA helicase-2/ATP-dependent DNA helicase PcrA
MDPILSDLNAAQHTAVTSPSNVVQVLAPPGSGKTKTLTSRVAYLLQHHHYQPWNVICLTFTIKSSREMKDRIAKLIGNGIESKLILGTFHSVCRRYLVTYGHKIGIPKGFGIADSSDTISIIKRIVKRLGINADPRKTQSRISSSKSRGTSHAELAQENAKKKNVEQQEFAMLFEAYESQLARSNLLDYDDLLLRTVDLLRQHPTCVSDVEAVLIDEFQDTNLVQFDLMRLFAAKNKRVTTVGDPDQSIYGWRSAEIKNLKRMQNQYPDTLVIHLEENYRSSAAILLAAQEVIEQDESRPSKSLSPTHCPGTRPVLRRLPSAETEASWIVSEILRTIGLSGPLLAFHDFAILLRSAALSRQIEAAMGRAGIAYRMVGGQRFFDRAEVKILLDYLRVISQPHNNDAVSRIVNIPTRGIGPTTLKGLLEEAEVRKLSLWSLIRQFIQGHTTPKTKISKAAEQGLGSFITIVRTSQKKVFSPDMPQSPEHILRHIIKKLDFQAYIEKHYAEDRETRWANIEELVVQAAEYPILDGADDLKDHLPAIDGLQQQQGNAAEEALSRFLANVALATELQREDEDAEGGKPQSQVTISTIHASKGLEWPVVFVPSTYEGCIPHSRAEDTDEERRLLYVAMTRAQALLYLSCPTKNSQREATTLSPFLSTKKVGKYLANKGPKMDSSAVNDMCRILGREHPTEGQIFDASKGLQSYEDSLWPLNGEEDVKSIGGRRSKWDDQEHPSKRRRIKDDFVSTSEYTLSTVGSTTTMLGGFAFSEKGNSSFVTAAARLQHITQEEAMRPKPIMEPRKTVSDFVKEYPRPMIMTKSTSRSEQGGQGTLLSLWGMGEKPKRKIEDTFPKGISEERQEEDSMAGRSHLHQRETAAVFTAIIDEGSVVHGGSTASRLLSAIPQNLANHRPQPLKNTTRPRLTAAAGEPPKKHYVFLSSSPPPIEPLLEEAETQEEEPANNLTVSSLENSEAANDIRPAMTLHTTSVAQINSGPKKTLGVRRSMNGWSARPNSGFSVPKMSGRR